MAMYFQQIRTFNAHKNEFRNDAVLINSDGQVIDENKECFNKKNICPLIVEYEPRLNRMVAVGLVDIFPIYSIEVLVATYGGNDDDDDDE